MTKTAGGYAFHLIHFPMLEQRAQLDFNCAIGLAQFTTVVDKCALKHVSEKAAVKIKQIILNWSGGF